jgi:hypothetical protein
MIKNKQMGIRYMQPIGKKGKGTWTKIKLADKNVVVIDDISKILTNKKEVYGIRKMSKMWKRKFN